MGKAAYLMRQFTKAKDCFETCLKINSNLEEASIELAKSEARIPESITGIYKFESIMAQYMKKENLNFDVADFKSHSIMLVDIPGKSKGIVANENINKGTLLVASKAISAFSNNAKMKYISTKVNISSNSADMNDSSQNLA